MLKEPCGGPLASELNFPYQAPEQFLGNNENSVGFVVVKHSSMTHKNNFKLLLVLKGLLSVALSVMEFKWIVNIANYRKWKE